MARADLVVSTGGLGPDARRPDPRGHRRRVRRDAGRRPGARGVAARALAAARAAVPGAQPQAGLAHPVGRGAAEPERHRARLVRATRRRTGGRRAARPAARDAPDVADEVLPRLERHRARDRRGRPDLSPHRHRRVAGRRPSRRRAAAPTNPEVATYARAEAVDVRISAVGDATATAAAHVEAAAPEVLAAAGEFVWATGDTTWPAAIGERLEELGWRLSVVEIGTAGQLAALLGDVPWLRFGESLATETPGALAHGHPSPDDPERRRRPTTAGPNDARAVRPPARWSSAAARSASPCATTPRHGDTAVSVTVVTPGRDRRQRRLVFLDGANGRSRAALAAAVDPARGAAGARGGRREPGA